MERFTPQKCKDIGFNMFCETFCSNPWSNKSHGHIFLGYLISGSLLKPFHLLGNDQGFDQQQIVWDGSHERSSENLPSIVCTCFAKQSEAKDSLGQGWGSLVLLLITHNLQHEYVNFHVFFNPSIYVEIKWNQNIYKACINSKTPIIYVKKNMKNPVEFGWPQSYLYQSRVAEALCPKATLLVEVDHLAPSLGSGSHKLELGSYNIPSSFC